MTARVRLGLGDALAHAEQYAAQTGQPLRAVLAKFGLAEPQIPAGWEQLWQWFWELDAGRSHNGFGFQPLNWQEMAAWAAVSGIHLQPWQARIFRAMDVARLAAEAESTTQKA